MDIQRGGKDPFQPTTLMRGFGRESSHELIKPPTLSGTRAAWGRNGLFINLVIPPTPWCQGGLGKEYIETLSEVRLGEIMVPKNKLETLRAPTYSWGPLLKPKI